ncbi:MAG: hypothetical protein QGH83_07455 [Candidatus Pacebacteria bacterium]|nr:hypothetical protein [Candidatus Paceibacterota bacterium]
MVVSSVTAEVLSDTGLGISTAVSVTGAGATGLRIVSATGIRGAGTSSVTGSLRVTGLTETFSANLHSCGMQIL